jgi:hypothetical protein
MAVQRDHTGRQTAPDACPMCGRLTFRRPRTGKLRYWHLCPHDRPCPAGDRLLGMHLNTYPPARGCAECRVIPRRG